MKKILFALFALFSVGVFVASADNHKVINKSQLPVQAQQFIDKHFAGVEVSFAKEEREILGRSYEVRLANGAKLEFSSKGAWEEVDCRFGEVPAGIVPAEISKFIKENYPDAKVQKIEIDRNDYEVKLSNRLELKFDKEFRLVDIDD
ncbi:MAG: PepSY-like domain-containing protein [Bacteroidaceae bacterium]|nr:PepSY-like domain-containing protein [Bacteroidaceae bacterium]